MSYLDDIKTAYLILMAPGALGLIFQFFASGDTSGFDGDVSFDGDAESHDHSGFKISLAAICNFLFGAGIAGYMTADYGPLLSIAVAIGAGAAFVWLLSSLFAVLHRCAAAGEQEAPEAKPGMICTATSNLVPGTVGSIEVLIGNRNYGYLAETDTHINVGGSCVIAEVHGNTVTVKPVATDI